MAKSSAFANSDDAYAWLTGDGFRAPVGTPIPSNAFTVDAVPSSGTGTPVLWDPFGAIDAGFEKTPTQNLTKLTAFNVRDSTYKLLRDPVEETLKFRALDYSIASVKTALQGGTISKLGSANIWVWNIEEGEEFAFLWTSIDGDDAAGFYCSKVTLGTPTPTKIDGKTIDGFDFELINLAPVKRLRSKDDLAV
ncbi:hypothetical protein CH300_20170 [Rhodococcus sp. 15-1154-1]|nr:hypothetical protein [Rhodococcus sp. 15-1154-1]OZF00856.1 hypothetical protein CH300_20170 [Rhodococcus sp. 15-1154-1]